MSKVDMLIEVTLNKDIPFGIAWGSISRDSPSNEEVKEFNERVFKCDCCGHWCPVVEENMVVDVLICDFCLLEGVHEW